MAQLSPEATDLIERISRLADQLPRDTDLDEPKPLYQNIQRMRRSLDTLEQDLRQNGGDAVGDAC